MSRTPSNGLGIIPYNFDINDNLEWCQPAEADPETAASDRYLALNGAVDRLLEQPNTHVYLDATHSRWLGVGDVAQRLVNAGVQRAVGFFLNVSNYQPTEHLERYGTWISKCIWFATDPGSWGNGHYDWCANQYYPANVDDFSTWTLTDQWYTDNTGQALVEAYLWVKIPGESDGECYRWTEGPLDPVRGVEAPPAGEWFADMALELVQNANPTLP